MNFKTPFKVLTTAALIGTLSLSAVAPGVSAATNQVTAKSEAEQPTTKIDKIIISKDGKDYTIDRVLYNQLVEAEDASVKSATIKAVVSADGTYYTREAYSQALAGTDSVKEAFAALEEIAKENTEVLVETTPGSIEAGENGVEVKDPTETPEEGDFEVTEIAAINQTVDKDTEGQKVSFTVNGEAADLEKLKEAGYTVKFLTTNDAALKDTATGELKAKLTSGSFTYQVEVSKEGEETITSNEAKVTIADLAATLKSLDSIKTAKESNTVVKGKTLEISEIVGKTGKDVEKKFTSSLENDFTFKSSDTSVALVGTTGTVKGVKAGTTTITATSKTNPTLSVSVEVKVAAETAEATNIEFDTTSVGVVEGNTQVVKATVTDQYGDPINLTDPTDLSGTVKNDKDETIATITSAAATPAKAGSYTLTFEGVKAGTADYKVKIGEKSFGKIAVKIGEKGNVASRKLEVASGSKTLDLNPTKENANEVVFNYNQYNADGLKIAAEKEIAKSGAKYTVTSSKTDVADVVVDANGNITVTGAKEGTATITIKEGSITRATAEVTVENSSPSITDVKFEDVKKITTLDKKISDLLKATGITLTSTADVQIDEEGNIFVDANDNETYDDGADILLGTYELVSADDFVGYNTSTGALEFTKTSGQFNLVVTANDKDETQYSTTVDVDIAATKVAASALAWHKDTAAFEDISTDAAATYVTAEGAATLNAKYSELTADQGGAPTEAIWAGLHIDAPTNATTAEFKVTGSNPRSTATEELDTEGTFANGFFYFFPVGVTDTETAKGGVATDATAAVQNNNVLTIVWKNAHDIVLSVETLTVKYTKAAE